MYERKMEKTVTNFIYKRIKWKDYRKEILSRKCHFILWPSLFVQNFESEKIDQGRQA